MTRLWVVGVLTLAACSDSAGSTTWLSTVGNLSLTPGNIRLTSGATQDVVCTARDGAGNPTDLPNITWLVADARIALVDDHPSGELGRRRILGTGLGNAVVRCRFGGITASSVINTVPFDVTVTPALGALTVGATPTVTATVATPAGEAVSLLSPLRIEWFSSAATVVQAQLGTAPGTAVLRALAPGTATITAQVRGFADYGILGTATIVVTVLPPS